MPRTVVAHIKGTSPYSQSKHYDDSEYFNVPKLPKERPDQYEKRTWRERLHVTSTGHVFIPAMAFKNGLSSIAKYLGIQIPGKGKATFTKHFEAGVLVLEGPVIQPLIRKENVDSEWLFLPADGKRGGPKRVMKCMSVIHEGWEADVTFYILDDTITEEIFKQHLEEFGRFIGLGRFRPERNGFYGRFQVESVNWGGEG
jgi:hypothetical protein